MVDSDNEKPLTEIKNSKGEAVFSYDPEALKKRSSRKFPKSEEEAEFAFKVDPEKQGRLMDEYLKNMGCED